MERVTNEEKRRAVSTLLGNPEWQARSNREIARACRVSAPFVGKIRAAIGVNVYSQTTRKGADGRTIETTNIGRMPAPMPPARSEAATRVYERNRERYATDPEYREQVKANSRRYYEDHRAAVIARVNRRGRERYASDPEYREKIKATAAKRGRERYATDPEYREKAKRRARDAYRRRAKGAGE